MSETSETWTPPNCETMPTFTYLPESVDSPSASSGPACPSLPASLPADSHANPTPLPESASQMRPGSRALVRAFGSWSVFVRSLGEESYRGIGGKQNRRFSKEDELDAVRAAYSAYGRALTMLEWDTLVSSPPSKAIQYDFGWSNVWRLVGATPYTETPEYLQVMRERGRKICERWNYRPNPTARQVWAERYAQEAVFMERVKQEAERMEAAEQSWEAHKFKKSAAE